MEPNNPELDELRKTVAKLELEVQVAEGRARIAEANARVLEAQKRSPVLRGEIANLNSDSKKAELMDRRTPRRAPPPAGNGCRPKHLCQCSA